MKRRLSDTFSAFLLDRHYRWARLLLVVTVLGIITASMVLSNIAYLGAQSYAWLEWGVYILSVFGLIAVNCCLLVPRYLLKERLSSYLIAMFLLVFATLSLLALLQSSLLPNEIEVVRMVRSSIVLNLISSFVSMTLMVVGSTAVMLFRYWMKSNRRIHELKSATLDAELQSLKQQINPHFLFNMLNNVNVLIWKQPSEAKEVLEKLETLLRYQLHDKEKERVWLASDIRFLHDFLNLEKIRRDNFVFSITEEGNIDAVSLPSLLFIPFVENAVKHNPDSRHQSYVNLSFVVTEDELLFCCENSKPVGKERIERVGGIGLKNIQRRLALLYAKRHTLEIREEENSYCVTLKLML